VRWLKHKVLWSKLIFLFLSGAIPKGLPALDTATAAVKEKISSFKTIDDYLKLRKTLDKSKAVAIIGGGFLGSELSCALARFGGKY
jgi:apoptosis-inducing factor 1